MVSLGSTNDNNRGVGKEGSPIKELDFQRGQMEIHPVGQPRKVLQDMGLNVISPKGQGSRGSTTPALHAEAALQHP